MFMRYCTLGLIVLFFSCKVTTPPKAEATDIFAKAQAFQLATPLVNVENTLFETNTVVTIEFDYPQSKIFYTLDGTEPTEQSFFYERPFKIQETAQLKVKAFHPFHLPSELVEKSFLKIENRLAVKKVELLEAPHQRYAGQGVKSLFDLKRGTADFGSSDWLGFDGKDAILLIDLGSPKVFEEVIISALSNTGAWIFPPAGLEAWVAKNGNDYELITKEIYQQLEKDAEPSRQFYHLKMKPQQYQWLKIIVKNTGLIPAWHPGKDTPAWLFIDEAIIK